MNKHLICFLLLNAIFCILSGQPNDPLIKKCISSSGTEAKYIKDFNIQLGDQYSRNEFRYKATMSLRKSTIYRFTMCTAENSKGQLILNIKDESDNLVISSFDPKTYTILPYVDFTCQKSGLYKIYFDFTEGKSGSGVSIVSKIQRL
jgi:hypothetical protein